MATFGTVNFDEEDGSPYFNISQNGIEVVQVGYTNWSDINAMYNYLMQPTLVFGTLFGVFAGAGFPDNTNMRVYKADVKPFGTITGADAAGVNIYNKGKWTIYYHTPPYNPQKQQDPVAMLQHDWDVGGEFIVPKGLKLKWNSDSVPVQGDSRGSIFIPTTEMSITWPRLVSPPFAAIRSVSGYVNNASMTFDTGTATPETLLFLGAKVGRDFLSDGSLAWKFSYKFSERRVPAADASSFGSSIGGWNHQWREDKAGFYKVTSSNGPPYPLGNLSALFPTG